MLKFVVRRVFWTIPIILLVIFMTFWMMRAIKGSPFRKSDKAVPPAVLANLDRKFGLDKPWYIQYERYVTGVATLRLRPLARPARPDVNDIVRQHFPVSAELGGFAMLLAILVGIPLGILSALRVNKLTDYVIQFFSNLGFAIPSFFTATLLIYFFAARLGLVPDERLGYGELEGAARDRALPLPAHVLRAARARPDARDAAAGLRADGEGEGPALAACRRRPRPAQLADPCAHGGRPHSRLRSSPARSSSRTSSRSRASGGTTSRRSKDATTRR